jgi:hypothetical protein
MLHDERWAGLVELRPGWLAIYGYGSPCGNRHEVYISVPSSDEDKDRVVGITSVDSDYYDSEAGRQSIRALRQLHIALLRRMIHLPDQTDDAKLYAVQYLLDIEKERIGQ